MKASRAKELLAMASYGSLKYAFIGSRGVHGRSSPNFSTTGISASEDTEIRAVWQTMSGNCSYADALRAISRNREVVKLEIKDSELIIQYSNGDFVAAHLNDELTAKLLDSNLDTISPEPTEPNFKPTT